MNVFTFDTSYPLFLSLSPIWGKGTLSPLPSGERTKVRGNHFNPE